MNTDLLIRKFHEKNQECESHKKKVRHRFEVPFLYLYVFLYRLSLINVELISFPQVKDVVMKGSQARQELDSLYSKHSALLKELEPLRQVSVIRC